MLLTISAAEKHLGFLEKWAWHLFRLSPSSWVSTNYSSDNMTDISNPFIQEKKRNVCWHLNSPVKLEQGFCEFLNRSSQTLHSKSSLSASLSKKFHQTPEKLQTKLDNTGLLSQFMHQGQIIPACSIFLLKIYLDFHIINNFFFNISHIFISGLEEQRLVQYTYIA